MSAADRVAVPLLVLDEVKQSEPTKPMRLYLVREPAEPTRPARS
ncbi:MAG TPA: hypothetical protein VNZ53_02570 [Steroidobacteraceae bacterium]|nr:hypothetical protein [Steroidobacteraceae bacterium]